MRKRNDIFTFYIDRFIADSARLADKGGRVLDAGAGDCPYQGYFEGFEYESTDIRGDRHTFLCDVVDIPRPGAYYDVVLCTQVLEHVKYPQEVMDEFYRVLRPSGMLFLSAPQGWKVHGEPFHYFNFTRYGLELLFREAGFKIVSIRSVGGVCWYLCDIIRTLPLPFLKQFLVFVLFYLDRFDREQKFTMGYLCHCIKER